MLEGTDLGSAYAPIINASPQSYDESFFEEPPRVNEKKVVPKIRLQEENPINQQLQQIAAIQKTMYQKAPQQQKPQQVIQHTTLPLQQQQQTPQQVNFDNSIFNRQFENQMQQQQINMLVNELKKQKTQTMQQPQQGIHEETYIDKLISKKKDVMKFLQSGLIILFAISLHFIIDFFLKHYLQTYDISWNREVFIRVLYPVGVLFIAWNLIALAK